jgi:hypothetical protein
METKEVFIKGTSICCIGIKVVKTADHCYISQQGGNLRYGKDISSFDVE